MCSRTPTAVLATAALSVLAVGLLADPASAHGDVEVGDHEFVIGFGTEPAYAGFPNSAQVLIHHHDGDPVTEIEGKLQVEVIYGDESRTFALEPNFSPGVFGEEGDYRSWFVPTRPGRYTLRIFGRMEGEKVDAKLTSGPKTFSDVLDTGAESFPVQDPTTGELSERLARELPRVQSEVAATQSSASDDASSARTLAIAGIVVGALGLLVGGIALAASRKR
jgi:hypothetical protein